LTKRDPWQLYPSLWKSKSAFFTYLRGQLRLTWSRYPAKLKWKASQLISPPKGYIGRAKRLGQCHYCKEMFAASHLEVDHVEQAGKCDSWETSAEFLYKLLDCNDNWVLACKPCHKCKSYAERKGISFEEAALEKKVIDMMKQPAKIVLAFLSEHGYNGETVSNSTKRKQALQQVFLKEQLNAA
jgi:5-methylcytosine-specific restriction endonuclease McrA